MNLQIYFRGVHRDSPIFVASFCRTFWCVYSEINFINLTVEFDSRMAFSACPS